MIGQADRSLFPSRCSGEEKMLFSSLVPLMIGYFFFLNVFLGGKSRVQSSKEYVLFFMDFAKVKTTSLKKIHVT